MTGGMADAWSLALMAGDHDATGAMVGAF